MMVHAQPSAAPRAPDPMLARATKPTPSRAPAMSRPGERASQPSRRAESAWVRAAQRGSAEALEALFRAHWSRGHRAAYLIVHDAAAAEDIAQEAFLSAVRALDRFDRRRPFGPWLHRIVVNRAIDYARARALRSEVCAEVEPAGPAADGAAPYSDVLTSALGTLSPEHRAVIVMRYLLELTPGEIGRALDLPRGTVNSRLRRGLDALGALLDEDAR
jgi:RNA polymerase sigma-70 factor (ECF subfamily)